MIVVWTVAALVLCLSLVPAALLSLRGELVDRVVGLELSGMLVAQLCALWAVVIDRPSFMDVGLTVAVLAFGGGLVFARFLERWL